LKNEIAGLRYFLDHFVLAFLVEARPFLESPYMTTRHHAYVFPQIKQFCSYVTDGVIDSQIFFQSLCMIPTFV
jgi:hypothetical protein